MKINHATFFDIRIHNCAYVYENIQLQTWSSSTLLTLGFWMDLNVSLQQQLGGVNIYCMRMQKYLITVLKNRIL